MLKIRGQKGEEDMACRIDYIPFWSPRGKLRNESLAVLKWRLPQCSGMTMLQETHLIKFSSILLTESNSLDINSGLSANFVHQPLWKIIPFDDQVYACMLNCFSRVRLFASLWTVAFQAPQSMEFTRQEYRSGLPSSPPGHLPGQGIEPMSSVLQVDSLLLSHWGSPDQLYTECLIHTRCEH